MDLTDAMFAKLGSQLELASIRLNIQRTDLSESNHNSVNQSGTLPFVLNTPEADVINAYNLRESFDHDDFWVVRVVGAYQYTEEHDGDGDSSSGISMLGATGGHPLFRQASFIFRETIRVSFITGNYTNLNEAVLLDLTVCHEIGHLFGISHSYDNGNITMANEFLTKTYDNLMFSGQGLLKIASTKRPG